MPQARETPSYSPSEILVPRDATRALDKRKVAAKAAAVLSDLPGRLSAKENRDIVAHRQGVLNALKAYLATVQTQAVQKPTGVLEMRGGGLGETLSSAEGLKRLRSHVRQTAIEDWAGPVAGPTALAQDLKIPRSTLHAWQKSNAVLGLLHGTRKHLFPLAQFVDGRPVKGLGAIADVAGSPRTAWLWLVEPNASLRGSAPLDLLKQGRLDDVLDLAARDFAQS